MRTSEAHEAYAAALAAVPDLARLVLPAGTGEAGPVLASRPWLEHRVDDTVRRWDCPDRRTAATLWWYSASSVLLAPVAVTLLVGGAAVDPSPARLTLALRADGLPAGTRAERLLPAGPAAAGRAVAAAFDPTVRELAAAGGASPRSLWSIAADSLAARLLWAGTVLGDPRPAVDLARPVAEATGGRMPVPRWVEVAGRTFLRRGSCCLLYQTPENAKCASCPRHPPDIRHALLEARA